MSTVDFSQLPQPNLIEELDFERIFNTRKENFISLYPASEQAAWRTTLDRESDPVCKLLEENAYLELLYRNKLNNDARALLLAYSTGADLDHIAMTYYGLQRLMISPADTSVVPPLPAVMESDESLKERCLLSLDAMNTAGSANGYKFFAKSADGRVADVMVISDELNPYLLDIVITQHDSETGQATAEVVAIVQAGLDAESVRPICDRPTVKSSVAVSYQIIAQLFMAQSAENAILIDVAQQRLQAYIEKQKKIGQSIRLSAIYAALHVDGVSRVVITQPAADIEITDFQHAYCTSNSITIGGTE